MRDLLGVQELLNARESMMADNLVCSDETKEIIRAAQSQKYDSARWQQASALNIFTDIPRPVITEEEQYIHDTLTEEEDVHHLFIDHD